jgi:polyvinyl alcohol dehydrogenase (cytochrome)
MPIKLITLALVLGVSSTLCIAASNSENPDYQAGKQRFEVHCAGCHSGAVPEAPRIEALHLYPPGRIVQALSSGVMSTAGLPFSNAEMEQIAYYLTGKTVAETGADLSPYYCAAEPVVAGDGKADWGGWGGPDGNRRFQPGERELNRDNVGNLQLDWVFAFPQATRVRSQPTVADAMTYIGSQDGTVYALDTDTGCIHWTFQADAEVRGAIKLHVDKDSGNRELLFGDIKANAYSIDALTGGQRWKTRVHDHAMATITGSVVADQDRVYVPVSSSEVVPSAAPSYPCCTFRGALVALSRKNGALAWRTYTTPEPVLRGKNSVGSDKFGPSGAPIWSSPTLDAKRNLVIVTTGQNYSTPATDTSDAVIAMDAVSGKIQWVSQVTANDAWNGGCIRKTENCPDEDGPDFDVGASAMLTTARSGKELLLVGQKSGLVYAMDPNANGKILWRKRVGRGGTMGGVHWGMSTDGERLYVGISDLPTNNRYAEGEPHPGLHALNPETGDFLWRTELPNTCPSKLKFMCFPGISAAVSSTPGVVYAGALDGMLRAFDASNGDILWDYNTHREFSTLNGIKGLGGAIEADGPVVAGGKLFVTSGYDKWGEMPGNVLLVFSLVDRQGKAAELSSESREPLAE